VVQLLLERMERWLAANRPAYFAGLQPGITDAQLDAFEARFSLKLPAAFRALYHWRNGQADGNYKSLQMNRMLSPLESVADTKALFDSMIGSDFDRPGWRRGWVPFLSNGGGSHLCVDVAAEDGGQPGQLIAFWKADEDRDVEYPSIEAWLADLVESMESGELEVV
jgi:cell wall assembly regulator SMI1